jgi:error-prone DNA polymerase
LEPDSDAKLGVRLGLRQVSGVPEAEMLRLVTQRSNSYLDIRGLWRRLGLARRHLERLAEAEAFRSVGLDRRESRPVRPHSTI